MVTIILSTFGENERAYSSVHTALYLDISVFFLFRLADDIAAAVAVVVSSKTHLTRSRDLFLSTPSFLFGVISALVVIAIRPKL